MRSKMPRNNQQGAVSLFVVIFSALLLTIVTVGFVQLMLKDQQQASIQDLSQSARDSAEAGIEDAKRLLLLDQACRDGTAASTINCTAIATALLPEPGTNETGCRTLSQAGLVVETNNETIIRQDVGDAAEQLNQAYTCVKIAVNTDDFEGDLVDGDSWVVPLVGVGDFDTVVIEWFNEDNAGSPTVGFPGDVTTAPLPRIGSLWPRSNPPLLRTQLMQLGNGFKLSEFDDNQAGKSNNSTLFLYPAETALETKEFALDGRRSSIASPEQVKCSATFTDRLYACRAILALPAPIDGNIANRNAYLRLSALYNNAHFRVSLKKAGADVLFNRVQPVIDSTGRANDVFRRTKARIEFEGTLIHPQQAIDMEGDLCKDFTVTDAEDGYKPSPTCIP